MFGRDSNLAEKLFPTLTVRLFFQYISNDIDHLLIYIWNFKYYFPKHYFRYTVICFSRFTDISPLFFLSLLCFSKICLRIKMWSIYLVKNRSVLQILHIHLLIYFLKFFRKFTELATHIHL